MEITISKTEDHNELILLWELSVRATHDFLSEDDIVAYKALIKGQYLKTLDLYCSIDGGIKTGFVGLQGNLIQMLFVHPAHMAKGIGKALVHFAVTRHGANEVDVNEQNTKALGFYKSLGFEAFDRFETDDAGKPYPILSLSLTTHSRK